MNYPFWDAGIGYGVLMGTIAVLHVFVSHFAIGGGLYLVVAETAARKRADTYRMSYLEGLTRFFVLISLVWGALSGVGIWFIIGLLNPTATEALIHNFVWGWAIEWTFFVVEIAAAILYFYGWKRMTAKAHLVIGWVYFWAAWFSLVVINGIIGFMLTPGKWLETGNFWDGFLNPTYWPSLVFRTGICVLLAGLYANLAASRRTATPQKARLVRSNAVWSIAGIALIVPSWLWYWKVISGVVDADTLSLMPAVTSAMAKGTWALSILAVLVVVFGLLMSKQLNVVFALALMALGLGFFGGFEWTRESVRKPFVIYNYMYGNAIEVADAETYRADGYLPHIAFRTGDDGADLFRRACRSCHTLDGYKPIAQAFAGTDPEFIANLIQSADLMRGNMPPFFGTPAEARLIADHIWRRVDGRTLGEIYGLTGVELGRNVFARRCACCHLPGSVRDNHESLVGLSNDEYNDIFDNPGDYGEGMPAFTGSNMDRAALIEYLKTFEEGGGR